MLTAVAPRVEISPILTVGDTLASGYRFEAIPDGIAVRTRKGGGDGDRPGRVDVYVNHETSKVPFPYNALTPTAANGENDFEREGEPGVLDGVGRGAQGLVRDLEQSGTTPSVQNLATRRKGQPGHPVHERGIARLRVSTGGLVAADVR